MRRYLGPLAGGAVLLLSLALLAGCSGAGSIQSRKSEKAAAFAGLPDDMKQAVLQGQIKVGMPMDAVYIAWGPPAESLQSEDPGGAKTVWVYYGGWMEETRYWGRRNLYRDYQPRTYVRAEVVFRDGKVLSWRTLPQPVY